MTASQKDLHSNRFLKIAGIQGGLYPMEHKIQYHTVQINGLNIFTVKQELPARLSYAHGFPTSSHMYRQLIPALADQYHVIAPDYPGFGYSAPDHDQFRYSFDHFSQLIEELLAQLNIQTFYMYLMDYGAPSGSGSRRDIPSESEA